jgi:hypothetical protein
MMWLLLGVPCSQRGDMRFAAQGDLTLSADELFAHENLECSVRGVDALHGLLGTTSIGARRQCYERLNGPARTQAGSFRQ